VSHVDLDRLAALALEPADGTDDERRHLESCEECAALLASLVDVRRLAGEQPLVPAPARVRARVLAQVREPSVDDGDDRVAQPLPISESSTARRQRRGIPPWVAGLAAAVALLAGLGIGRLTGGGEEAPEAVDPGTVVAAADLTALDSDASRGEASAVRTDDVITLRVSASELGDQAGVHEVWLINVDGERMISVGLLASGEDGEFEVPMGLIEEGYRIVDISVEPDDGDPTHSGVSLARGELA
jgi:Anti-sigma-K factor rskA